MKPDIKIEPHTVQNSNIDYIHVETPQVENDSNFDLLGCFGNSVMVNSVSRLYVPRFIFKLNFLLTKI